MCGERVANRLKSMRTASANGSTTLAVGDNAARRYDTLSGFRHVTVQIIIADVDPFS